MSLKDFISKLPLDKIAKVYIDDARVTIPSDIDNTKFYNELQADIKQNTLTTEKAIFAANSVKSSKYKSSTDLLNSKLVFN